jgi:hypothetical protein
LRSLARARGHALLSLHGLLPDVSGHHEAELLQLPAVPEEDDEVLLVIHLQDAGGIDLHELPSHGEGQVARVEGVRRVLAPRFELVLLEARALVLQVDGRLERAVRGRVHRANLRVDRLGLVLELAGREDHAHLVVVERVEARLEVVQVVQEGGRERAQQGLQRVANGRAGEQVGVPERGRS